MNYLSTQELSVYVTKIYKIIEPVAKQYGIYKPLDIYFATSTPHNQPGEYCYSDEKGYHYCVIGDRGRIYPDNIIKTLFEISYLIIGHRIWLMSSEFEVKNRLQNQDSRRIIFKKELEFFDLLGEEYRIRAEMEIANILRENPFVD